MYPSRRTRRSEKSQQRKSEFLFENRNNYEIEKKAGSNRVKLLEQEVSLLKEVYHENIIELFAVYETNNALFMIFDYCEQELGSYFLFIRNIGVFD